MKTTVLIIATFFIGLSTLISANASDGDKKLTNKTVTEKSVECSQNTTENTHSFQANIFQNASGRVSLILLKEDQQPVMINIFDQDNNLIFKQKIKEDSVRQNFLMNNLDTGEYTFTISKNGECFTKTVTVK